MARELSPDMATVYIKNMVCGRCIMVVQQTMERLGLTVEKIQLGEVTLARKLTLKEKSELAEALTPLGFEIIDNRKSRIIERIKMTIIELVHHQQDQTKHNLSEVLGEALELDYSYLSSLFSAVEGTTIEKYYIAQKIEKVKELLVYDELTLNEIAEQLNYSSTAYLSNQFKKVTGLTPSHFRQVRTKKRKAIDEVK